MSDISQLKQQTESDAPLLCCALIASQLMLVYLSSPAFRVSFPPVCCCHDKVVAFSQIALIEFRIVMKNYNKNTKS